ncbi:hypothetical protein [Moraxella catarrhalis]|uniref:hypothetical protein n=1 Tax=Moraxella catarrhalis TaxID=480 RepID=UPI0007F3FA10|nr:hypothetical protein [Moraxella catarrhalis]OAV31195.1 hypothetical protein AO368_0736 [Moraxella catarrhalis]
MSQEIIEWEDRKKTIQTLIEELKSFENQDLIVMVTSDEGEPSTRLSWSARVLKNKTMVKWFIVLCIFDI